MANNRIHFGSLEAQERQRLLRDGSDTMSMISQQSTRAQTVVNQSINNQQTEQMEVLEFTQHSEEAKKAQEELEKKYELQKQMRGIKVPTSESEIKSQLRQLGHPVTYFGETAAARRERLRKSLIDFLTTYGDLPQFESKQSQAQQSEYRDLENNYFLYEGIPELKQYRLSIAKYSLHNASIRVEKQRLRRLVVDALDEDKEVISELQHTNNFQITMQQFADPAGVSRGCISPNQSLFATAGGSGECKLWNLQDSSLNSSLLGHLTKSHSIAFHPQSTISLSSSSQANIATASADLTFRLWTLEQERDYVENLGILQKSIVQKGHEDRVNQVLFHQMGTLLFSVSYDKTWRMWDLERIGSPSAEIMCQTGHSKAIYSAALHPDGSLLFTGDLGGAGMIWDLRIGKGILPLNGHVKGILASDFSTNGYQLATGGDDNNIRIWDLRRRSAIEKIPAHIKLVSDVKFQPNISKYLISTSYDGTVKIWNSRDWSLHKVYKGHDSKMTSVCLTRDLQRMITTATEKKFVIWEKTFDSEL